MFGYGAAMPDYQLRFTDPPADLLEKLKPILVGQGDPPLYVMPADGGVRFAGPGAEFLVRARAADALTTVWPDWHARLVQAGGEN